MKKVKEEMKKKLAEVQNVYADKELQKEKLENLKKEANARDLDYEEQLRVLRQIIEQDKKKGVFDPNEKKKFQMTKTRSDDPKTNKEEKKVTLKSAMKGKSGGEAP